MNKNEALKKLATLEDYISLGIDTYEKVCKQLGEKELTINDFNHLPEHLRHKNLIFSKLQQVGKLFNGDWKPNIIDRNQKKHYPYFEITADGGLVYDASFYDYDGYYGHVVYFKDEKIAMYIGKTFINLYKEIHESRCGYVYEL